VIFCGGENKYKKCGDLSVLAARQIGFLFQISQRSYLAPDLLPPPRELNERYKFSYM